MPQLSEDTQITGALLRQAREALGLSLDDYVRVTKISIYYLRNIENEEFDDLPAPVYVRGYLRQMAQILKLDPGRVCAGYLERMQRAD
jgi:flagellar biosynthesis protein FlhG